MSNTSLRPLRGEAILRPLCSERASSNGRIIVPSWEPYPQAGICIASAAPSIDEGDLVVIPVESADVSHTYSQVLCIVLLDPTWTESQEVLVPMDTEPLFRETYEKYLRDGEEKRIVIQDLSGEGWAFETSDVLTYEVRDTSSPAFSILYPAAVKMAEWEGELLYFIKEGDALCLIKSS